MRKIIAALSAIGASVVLGAANETPLGEGDPMEVTDLGGRVLMVEGYGGNVAVGATGEGLVFSDAFLPESAPALIETAMATFDEAPRIVVSTHHHGDHTLGLAAFHEAGALSIGHTFMRHRIAERRFSDYRQDWVEPRAPELLPRMTYDSAFALHLGDQRIALVHYERAHTAGDTVVHFIDADVIATGDIFVNGVWPIIDHYAGGSVDGTLAALDEIIALAGPDTDIVPGHGPLASRADVIAYRAMLDEMRHAVLALQADGMSPEEIAEADPLAALAPDWRAWFTDSADVAAEMAREFARVAE